MHLLCTFHLPGRKRCHQSRLSTGDNFAIVALGHCAIWSNVRADVNRASQPTTGIILQPNNNNKRRFDNKKKKNSRIPPTQPTTIAILCCAARNLISAFQSGQSSGTGENFHQPSSIPHSHASPSEVVNVLFVEEKCLRPTKKKVNQFQLTGDSKFSKKKK